MVAQWWPRSQKNVLLLDLKGLLHEIECLRKYANSWIFDIFLRKFSRGTRYCKQISLAYPRSSADAIVSRSELSYSSVGELKLFGLAPAPLLIKFLLLPQLLPVNSYSKIKYIYNEGLVAQLCRQRTRLSNVRVRIRLYPCPLQTQSFSRWSPPGVVQYRKILGVKLPCLTLSRSQKIITATAPLESFCSLRGFCSTTLPCSTRSPMTVTTSRLIYSRL